MRSWRAINGWGPWEEQRGSSSLPTVARLTRGSDLAEANAGLDVIGRRLSRLLGPTMTTGGGVDYQLARVPSTSPTGTVPQPRIREVERLPQALLLARSQQATSPNRSWVKRHPVLFGAIVGAVAGAAIVGATVHAEASFVGFYGGGAAGAMVGWVVSR